MRDRYESPLGGRYASDEMQYLFSAQKRAETWRELSGSSFQKRSLRSCSAALGSLRYRRKKFRGSLSLKKLNMQKNQRGCSLP